MSLAIICGVDEDINHRAKLVPVLKQRALYFRLEYLNVFSFPFYQQPGAVGSHSVVPAPPTAAAESLL